MMVSTAGMPPATLTLFCKVVDNFGDIGICWRLARQLSSEHRMKVTLWVDDLASFKRLAPAVRPELAKQQVAGVTVRRWEGGATAAMAGEVDAVVIEFFGCDIPDAYVDAMARCQPPPIWLNLEGLSAEKWVEGCHGLPSPHPRYPLTKWFYFPGFNERTGGLLREHAVLEEARAFALDARAIDAFLAGLGVEATKPAALRMSLFCYPHAPVATLFAALAAHRRPILCLVPQGVAAEAVAAFLGEAALPGALRTQGALTVQVIPFLAQTDYDRLLWACDVNFVRGEDSFVRAQWAGKPFVWHIYPQDEKLHHVKLQAFLDTSLPGAAACNANLLWNDALADCSLRQESSAIASWQAFLDALPTIADRTRAWRDNLAAQDDLATQLLRLAMNRRAAAS